MKFIVVLMLLIQSPLQAQTDFESIEQQIIDSYQILKTAHLEQDPERQHIFSAKLRSQILFALLQKGSYYYPFLRLRQYLNVVQSSDKKIRIFSWDELNLSTWRTIYSVAQFRGVRNESYFTVLSDGSQKTDNYKDAFIQEIHLLNNASGVPYYLLLGKGSHAKYQEHGVLRVFYLAHNQLLECKDCFEGNQPYWSMEGSTQYPVELKYHPRRKQVYYYQPTYHPKTGQRKKGLHYQMYWDKGSFNNY